MTGAASTRVDRELLAKICGMLGSAHDGEIAAAGRAANAMVLAAGATWSEILAPPPPRRLDPPPREPMNKIDVGRAIRLCLDNRAALLDWEAGFIECLQWQDTPPGPVQEQLLARIAAKARTAAARSGRAAPEAKPRKSRKNRKRRRAA
jgi:hypothetical protein